MKRVLMQQYIRLTEFLGRTLGPDYEIVLLDLADPAHAVAAIANQRITGLSVGAPLDHAARQLIEDASAHASSFRVGYHGQSADGRPLRSSALFIRDESEQLVGLLCIHFDDSRCRELSDRLLRLFHTDAFLDATFQYDESRLHAAPSGGEARPGAVTQAAAQLLAEMGRPADRLTQEEKLAVMRELEEQGLFLLKGAVKEAAACLHCSQASVYRYLSKLRGETP